MLTYGKLKNENKPQIAHQKNDHIVDIQLVNN